MLRRLWKWFAATFSVAVILLALMIGLFRLLLQASPEYHTRIEEFASEAAGAPVRVAEVDLRWRWVGPELLLEGVRLLRPDGTATLVSAQRGNVVIAAAALFQGKIRASQVLLEDLVLDVELDENGRLRFDTPGDGPHSWPQRLAVGFRDAVLNVHGFNGVVTRFDDVDLDVRFQNDSLRIQGSTRPPAALGRSVSIGIEADGDVSVPSDMMWQVYVECDAIDLAGWRHLVPAAAPPVPEGRGDLVVWAALDGGRLQQASARFDLRDVRTPSHDDLAPAHYERVRGHVEWDRGPQGWHAAGRELQLERGGEQWPLSTFDIERMHSADGGGEVSIEASFLGLDRVLPFAAWIPDAGLRDRLRASAASGDLYDLRLRVATRDEQVQDYDVRAGFDRLGFAARESLPGIRGLTGRVRADATSGRLEITATPLRVDAPRLYDRVLDVDTLEGVLVWRRGADGWRVLSDRIELGHRSFLANAGFELRLAHGETPPVLDLHGTMRDVDVAGARDLVPDNGVPPRLARWIDQALVAGTFPSAQIAFSGPVDRYPSNEGPGRFTIRTQLIDGEIDYSPRWPAARNVVADISLDNLQLSADVEQGEIGAVPVTSTLVTFPDLRTGVLHLEAAGRATLDELMSFLVATPAVAALGSLPEKLDLDGAADVVVALELPLRQLNERDVRVTLDTESATLGLNGWQRRMEDIGGQLRYVNGRFSGEGLAARLLGAPVMVDVVSAATSAAAEPPRRAATLALIRGHISDRELANLHPDLPDAIGGSTAWEATVRLPAPSSGENISVTLTSRLEGLEVLLPRPLAKLPATRRDLRLSAEFLPAGETRVVVENADLFNGTVAFTSDGTLRRGALNFGGPVPALPAATGLEIMGSVDHLELGGWLALLKHRPDGEEEAEPGNQLRLIDLDVARLDAFGQRLAGVALTLDRSATEWLVQVDSEAAAGSIFVPFDLSRDEPIVARMERLALLGSGGGRPAPPADPRGLPAIELSATQFSFDAMQLGRLEALILPNPSGVILERFVTEAPSFQTRGAGQWYVDTEGHHTRIEARLTSTDVGASLESLAFDKTIDSPEGEVNFALEWPGPPGPNFRAHLSGEVSVQVAAGQITNLQPGAGRVFGLLSFAALPRRLSLDFRDVFDKGFGFDRIAGDFRIDDGQAFTENLVLEGPAAQVGIIGRAGLVDRDYDQTAVVYGNFGAALPVAGAIAAGPVGGAAMLIFSELFKKPLQNMARVAYRITGSWDDPQVERVAANRTAEGNS